MAVGILISHFNVNHNLFYNGFISTIRQDNSTKAIANAHHPGQLADMAEISINTLYKIERGQGNPTLQSLSKIADILGLELVLQVKRKDVRK